MAESMTRPVVSLANQVVGECSLPDLVFGGPVRRHLLYEVVRMQMANRRAGTHATKTRGSVSGGGKKPWRQKGTGRARAGSIRSPLWPGGATVFGPQPRDYSYRMPRTARIVALRSAMAAKARNDDVIIVDRLELDAPKTKVLARVLSELGASDALVIIPERDDGLERASRNLPTVKVLRVEGVNVYDVLRYRRLVLTRDAMHLLEKRLGG